MIDHEAVYQCVYEQRWGELLDVLHRHHAAITDDPLLAHAVETFVGVFFDTLDVAVPAPHADVLEKLFLLHTGGFYRLSEAHFDQVVEALVAVHSDRPEAAAGYARFSPSNPRCAEVLAAHASRLPVPVAHAGPLDVAASAPLTQADATTSLFKSKQELDFFLAVREVFATYFVYPNVALSGLIDYERLRDHLSGPERQYFFRALVDCVVFDQHDGYRPCYFFELDSPLHDAEARQANDRRKERILALAGQTLYRIRPRTAVPDRSAFITLLKELAEQ